MAWYKFEAQHGPGHQGYLVAYYWIEGSPDKDDLKERWEDFTCVMEDPVGHATKVKALPEDVRQQKINHYRFSMERAMKMLKILKAEIKEVRNAHAVR
jgi:hypothetical protein